ncbi:MAG: hypothetical protein MUD15_10700 [Desulfobacterota bacterium]|nr:hypothetical protein [Thermodesulfobacteriota bacterium]
MRRLLQALSRKNREKALGLCNELREERIVLHDLFADTCTALFSWVGRNLGEETLEEMFRDCFGQSAKRQIFDLLNLGIEPGLEALMLARNAWVAHSCSGAGEHGGSFRLIEDDEKFTFILDPCGSGGRLWRKMRYDPPGDFATTSRPYPWTYGRKDFPYYCIHCSFLNEILPHEHLGFISWPVDPPEHAMDVCKWHIYKDRNAVPDGCYARFGLTRKQLPGLRKTGVRRWFTQDQLREAVRPTPERIREKLLAGDLRGARRIGSMMAGEFLFLHHLYVNMVAATLDFIARRAGEEVLGDVFAYIYKTCFKEQIVAQVKEMTPERAITYLVANLFLADTCGGAGMNPAKVRIDEDDEALTIYLDPCGSGGKLMRSGAYERGNGSLRREDLENRVLKAAMRLPLPRWLLEATMPFAVTYFTETRKPLGLHRTRKGYDWSGGTAGMPYFCCICTDAVRLAGCRWLTVTPPGDDRKPCVWRADKRKV